MSHAHRKVAWVKRRGAAVRQRRAMRNGAYLFGKRYTPVPWNAPVVATPVADIRAMQERIASIRLVSLDGLEAAASRASAAFSAMEQPITELSLPYNPAPTTFSGQISNETLRKIAAMFPMEDSHEQE